MTAVDRTHAVVEQQALKLEHPLPMTAVYRVVPGPPRWELGWCVTSSSMGPTPIAVTVDAGGKTAFELRRASACDAPQEPSTPAYVAAHATLAVALDRARAYIKQHGVPFDAPRLTYAAFVVTPQSPRWKLSWCVPSATMGLVPTSLTVVVDGDVELDREYGGDCKLPSPAPI